MITYFLMIIEVLKYIKSFDGLSVYLLPLQRSPKIFYI